MRRLNSSILVFLCCCAGYLHAQDPFTLTLQAMESRSFDTELPQHGKAPFMWVASSNPVLRYNPLSLGFGSLMFVYQRFISRHFSANCLYQPSCSNFSRRLIDDLGLVKGVFLSADRVMRCNRVAAVDIPASIFDRHDHKVHESTGIYRLK
ncbi:MAG TPA: membrane protein insertion efficiency factor YidD [Bacteroidales bacterium]|nr:membrane protein insertion efficiency factor YidD [Bacteroidales bacterium]HSA43375.1 membrane protein insertion efficiency factor YidD [Bacteroidales bacterium]